GDRNAADQVLPVALEKRMRQYRDEAVGIAGRTAAGAWFALAGDSHAHFVVDARRDLNFGCDLFENLTTTAAGRAWMLDHRALAVALRTRCLNAHDAGGLNHPAL